MGDCHTKIKAKTPESKPVDEEETPDGQITAKIEIKTNLGLFSSDSCPIDNESIQNTYKQLNSFDPCIFGLKGQLIKEWKSVSFQQPCVKNEWWYFGQWKQDQMHGKGSIYNTIHECLITGMFNYDRLFKSNCRKIYQNGSFYTGALDENLNPHGQGQLVKSKKQKYVGAFLHGVYDGQGTEIKKQSQFIGQFSNGFKVYGILKDKKITYEGQFLNDMKHGKGTQIYQNGQKYVGQFSKNKRNGEGAIYDADGEIVRKGTWQNDKMIS